MRSLRDEVEEQARRARLVSEFHRHPIHLYVIRANGVTRATVVGASINPVHIDLVRARGGRCRWVCSFHLGQKLA